MTDSEKTEFAVQDGEAFKKNLLRLIPGEVQDELQNTRTEEEFRSVLKQHGMDLDEMVRKARSNIATDLPDQFLSSVTGGWEYDSGTRVYNLRCPSCGNADRNRWTWHPIDTWRSSQSGLIYSCDECGARLRVWEGEYGYGGVFVDIID